MKPGVGRHCGLERIERHRHAEGYLAVVLSGGYVEAGDGGRLRVSAGDVVAHEAWSAHRDEFGPSGASILNLPIPSFFGERAGRVDDVDAIARLAETDCLAAADLARDRFTAADVRTGDWPDLLAAALAERSDLPLAAWADRHGIAATSLSRGFAAAYGVSPKRFRLEQRTRRALRELPRWSGTLAALAAEAGFADQAHFTRAVRDLTGRTPCSLR
ncbi:MAG: AraC family transcriptional regulator [Alphaproteobacteria bacterium]|nr:AraC family transcriptional regulator [Alphaproteobacteria bacterium]